jgi:hypothetical protein
MLPCFSSLARMDAVSPDYALVSTSLLAHETGV